MNPSELKTIRNLDLISCFSNQEIEEINAYSKQNKMTFQESVKSLALSKINDDKRSRKTEINSVTDLDFEALMIETEVALDAVNNLVCKNEKIEEVIASLQDDVCKLKKELTLQPRLHYSDREVAKELNLPVVIVSATKEEGTYVSAYIRDKILTKFELLNGLWFKRD